MSEYALESEQPDMQRLVVRGYSLEKGRHFILSVIDAARARAFLREILRRGYLVDVAVTTKALRETLDEYCPVDIGLTFRGLEALGLPRSYLQVFREKARAFSAGAPARAAQFLADTGLSASERWDSRFRADRVHVALSLHADESEQLDRFTEKLRGVEGACGLEGWEAPLDAAHLSHDPYNRLVHFGLVDGVARVGICGLRSHGRPRQMHAPGYFLLGYKNGDGFNPWLLISPGRRNPWLLPTAQVDPKFFRNASFGAIRLIEQFEERFRQFVHHWAQRLEVSPEYIIAKMVGRWPDGRLIRPEETDKSLEPDRCDRDAFDLGEDPDGLGCPFDSHMRRMNGRATPVVPARRRPLIRRGMPYGPPYDEKPKEDRGLVGIFFCASIEDQFEHLLAHWADANPMGPHGHGTAKDPLIGRHHSPTAFHNIPLSDEKARQLKDFRRPYTRTRGTLYAFFPGKAALSRIANQDW
jgi:hypothetical protein